MVSCVGDTGIMRGCNLQVFLSMVGVVRGGFSDSRTIVQCFFHVGYLIRLCLHRIVHSTCSIVVQECKRTRPASKSGALYFRSESEPQWRKDLVLDDFVCDLAALLESNCANYGV
jgi:hypothetical protein